MVKHIVLWKIRDNSDKQNNVSRIVSELSALVGKIDGLVSMELGYNFNAASEYDVILYATFKNASALKFYQNHPEHVKCKQFIQSVTESRTAVDYFYEEGVTAARPFDQVPDAPADPAEESAAVKAAAVSAASPSVQPEKPIPSKPQINIEVPSQNPAPAPAVKQFAPKTEINVEIPSQKSVPVPDPAVKQFAPKTKINVEIPSQESAPAPDPTAKPFTPKNKINVEIPSQESASVPDPTAKPFTPKTKINVEIPSQESAPTPAPAAPMRFDDTPPAAPMRFDDAPPAAPMRFDDAPPAAPMRFDDAPPAEPMRFDDAPHAAPMRFDDAPPAAPMRFDDAPPAEPMRFDDAPHAAPAAAVSAPTPVKSASKPIEPIPKPAAPAPAQPPKAEKSKGFFGKKHSDVQVTPLEQRSDTWTCPNCGKIMPKYVGTCGCGEPQPFSFDDDPPALQPKTSVSAPAKPAAPAPAPKPSASAPAQAPKAEKSKGFFGKKHSDVQVTPLEQRSDTWTCPNCGKVMPKYVGTCGCGEPQPFSFDDDPPALQPNPSASAPVKPAAPAPTPKPSAPTPKPSAPAPKPSASAPAQAPKAEKSKGFFGKKHSDVQVTPLEQRSDTWTCPNCGKVMPKYVGTCGCGEPQPFSFDDDPPALQPNPSASAPVKPAAPAPTPKPSAPAPKPSAPTPAPPHKAEKSKGFFGKKHSDVQVTPLEQRSDTWTCPNCGKVMPKYVGTCGCGEPQPFSFDDDSPVTQGSSAFANSNPVISDDTAISDTSEFSDAGPSIQSYSPQTTPPVKDEPQSGYEYIKNDRAATSMPFGNPVSKNSDTDATDPTISDDTPAAPMRFDDAPPAAPMRFDDAPPAAPMRFDDAPPVAPMRFDDAPPAAPMRFDDAPPAAPMRFNDTPPDQPAEAPKKPEKKHFFGGSKKAKQEEVFRKAQEAVQSRKDVPNDGTWTCPNCGKVMPKYVGTCGCGEQQPFDF